MSTPLMLKKPGQLDVWNASWASDLGEGETITTSEWEIKDDDLTLILLDDASDHPPQISGAQVSVWIDDGVFGRVYEVQNRITTSLGRELEDAFLLEIVETAA